jgi:surface antigen
MANLSDGFEQVKLDNTTYGGYNPTTNQAVAFPDQNAFTSFFGEGSTFNPNAPKANFDYSGLLGSNAGQVKAVSVNSLTPASSLTVPTAQPSADSLAPAVASAGETSKSLEQYIKELTPPKTETSKQYDSIFNEINTLLPGTTGRGQAQLDAEAAAGLPEQKKKLAEINSQLLMKVAEATKVDQSYEQLIQQLESPSAQQQGVPMSIIIGQQAQARKLQLAERNSKAADIGLLQAFALGLQGQVQAAQEGVNRAIDLKYQDRESELNLKMQQLSLLEGKLSKEESIVKQALERKYTEEQAKIAEEKAKAKENINLAFSANVQTKLMNKGGEWVRVSDGKAYGTPAELFKDFPELKGSFDNAYKMGLVTDVTSQRLADLEFVQQLRSKYFDAGINYGDSPEVAAQKVKNSPSYYKDTYVDDSYTLSSGQVRYDAQGNIIAQGPAPQVDLNQLSDNERALMTQYTSNPIVKDFNEVQNNKLKIENIVKNGVGGPADLALVYTFMKSLDPTSVVRESEYESAAKSGNIFQGIFARFNGYFKDKGGRLPDNVKNEFLNLANQSYGAREQQYNNWRSQIRSIAERQGLNPDNVTPDFSSFLGGGAGNLQWKDPNTGDIYEFPDQNSLNRFKQDNGISFNSVGNTSASTTKALTSTLNKSYPAGSTGGQCGDFVRKVVAKLGGDYPTLGDSLKSKIAAVTKYGTSLNNAKPGSVIVTRENPTYGHVAYIIGKNAQGYIVAESNYKQSNKVSYGRVIPYGSSKIIGVINLKA